MKKQSKLPQDALAWPWGQRRKFKAPRWTDLDDFAYSFVGRAVVWSLVIVPAIARVLAELEDLKTPLPKTWGYGYFFALFFGAAVVWTRLASPRLIRQYRSYAKFASERRALGYVSEQVADDLAKTRKDTARVNRLQHRLDGVALLLGADLQRELPLADRYIALCEKSDSQMTREQERAAELLYWAGYDFLDTARRWARVFARFLQVSGVFMFALVTYENVDSVVKGVLASAAASGQTGEDDENSSFGSDSPSGDNEDSTAGSDEKTK